MCMGMGLDRDPINDDSIMRICIGKTMTANAVAKHLSKKVLLVTVTLMTETSLTKVL